MQVDIGRIGQIRDKIHWQVFFLKKAVNFRDV